MIQSKIIQYLLDLSPRQQERFRQFVHSPYFNQHDKTSELLEIILEVAPGPTSNLDRHKVFQRLFPGERFKEQKLHDLLSYIKKLFHRFLANEYFSQLDFREQLYTVEAAYEHNQFGLMVNRANQLDKVLTNRALVNSDRYYLNYRLNYLLGYYGGEYVDRSESDTLQKMIDNLDKYYIAEKLKNGCHLMAHSMNLNARYELRFLDEILDFVLDHLEEFEEDITIPMYYAMLMSLREENNIDHYRRMKKYLLDHTDELSAEDARNLYTFAYNYCIMKINQGQSQFSRELFQLYKQGIKNEILLTHGILGEWDYKNIATLGCSLKEFEWTEQFLEEYKEKIPAHQRENAYKFNLANLYYHKQLYEDTLSTLLHVRFTDVKYHLNTGFLLLRTYYAQGDTEALLSQIEALRIYVIRNRNMTTDQKRGYTNFLRFAKRLVQIKHQSAAYTRQSLNEKLNALAQKIRETDKVINRYWLLEECETENKKSEVEGSGV